MISKALLLSLIIYLVTWYMDSINLNNEFKQMNLNKHKVLTYNFDWTFQSFFI